MRWWKRHDAGQGRSSSEKKPEKFLIAPDGTVAARFAPQTEPDSAEVVAAVEENLPA